MITIEEKTAQVKALLKEMSWSEPWIHGITVRDLVVTPDSNGSVSVSIQLTESKRRKKVT